MIIRLLTAGCAVLFGIAGASPASAEPAPIPASVWISPGAIPMSGVYHWSSAQATATSSPSFLSTRLCGSPPARMDPSSSAISTQTGSQPGTSAVQSAARWTGDAASTGPNTFQSGIHAQLNACPGINDVQSVDVRPAPEWFGFAATLLVGDRDFPNSEVHIYNVAPPESGTVSELAVTVPRTGRDPSPWQPVDDVTVLRELAKPLCKTSC